MFCNSIKKGWITALMLLLMSAIANGATNNEIELAYFNHGDSVSLRWAPITMAGLKSSVDRGYIVQRKNVTEKEWHSISGVLKPMSDEEMSKLRNVPDDILLLRECFYGTISKEYNGKDTLQKDTTRAVFESKDNKKDFGEQMMFVMSLAVTDISLPVAKAAALHYVDKNVDKNASYQYRVIWADEASKRNVSVRIVDVHMPTKSILPPLKDFALTPTEKDAQMKWSATAADGFYSAYIVERSKDSVHFEVITPRPIIQAYADESLSDIVLFRDSFPNDEERFYYRVAGYSAFGFTGPYTKIIGAEAVYNFNKINVKIDTIITNAKKKYKEIKWSMDKKYESKIKGFKISRTPNFVDFDYVGEVMLSPNQRSFRINEIPEKTYYYAIDVFGLKKSQLKRSKRYMDAYHDSIPPASPTGLKATIDSTGLVTVCWNKNKEQDLRGYQLFFSNSGDNDDYFNVMDTLYFDTIVKYSIPLNTLTNEIYYKVLAKDLNFNPSPLSPAVKLLKPDTIPPVRATFDFLTQKDGKILVSWQNSPSVDLASAMLMRCVDDGKIDTLKTYVVGRKTMPTKYEDKEMFEPGSFVQYFMNVYDQVGNVTSSNSEKIKIDGVRQCVGVVTHKIYNNDEIRKIELMWEDSKNAPKINRYVVYRQENNGSFYPIASVEPTDRIYEDKKVMTDKQYVYYIRAISTEWVCPAKKTEPIVIEAVLGDKKKRK